MTTVQAGSFLTLHYRLAGPQGTLINTWQDARLFAAFMGAGIYFWRRDVLLTILAGMAVYLPLHLGLGW